MHSAEARKSSGSSLARTSRILRVGSVVEIEVGHGVGSGMELHDRDLPGARGLYDERRLGACDQEIAAAVAAAGELGAREPRSRSGLSRGPSSATASKPRERTCSLQASSPSRRLVTATASPSSLTPSQVPSSGKVPSGP